MRCKRVWIRSNKEGCAQGSGGLPLGRARREDAHVAPKRYRELVGKQREGSASASVFVWFCVLCMLWMVVDVWLCCGCECAWRGFGCVCV